MHPCLSVVHAKRAVNAFVSLQVLVLALDLRLVMASLRLALWWSLEEISPGKGRMRAGRAGLQEVRPSVVTRVATGLGLAGIGVAKMAEAIPRISCEIIESLSKIGDGHEISQEGGLLRVRVFSLAEGSFGPKV